MSRGPRRFRAAPLPTAVAVILFAVLVGLGLWQLQRAEEKRALLADLEAGLAAPPVRLDARVGSGEGLRYRRVEAHGRYDAAHQYLLDNKVQEGRVGYQVLTPLRLRGADAGVLVNRGWVPMGRTRADLPALPAPDGAVRITGLVKVPGEGAFTLGEGEARAPGWPKVLQRVDLALQSRQLGYRLLPVVVLLDPDAAGGFERRWDNPLPSGPERNVAYAVQWFAMAAVLAIIVVALGFRRGEADDGE